MTDAKVSLSELFWGFCIIGISGFGGVLPWSRRYIVEHYRWISPEEFAVLLGLCQVMPGPNVLNLSICVGNKFQGWRGAILAPLGIMLAPMLVVLGLGIAHLKYGELPLVRSVLHGVSAVGAGLILATGLKMLWASSHCRHTSAMAIFTVVLMAGFQMPLVLTVLVLFPIGIILLANKR